MSDHPDTQPQAPHNMDYEDIPVEELIKLTRELTQRITNADRQRLALELRESGHSRIVQNQGPISLQQFFRGEIDLDTELARRFAQAPLLSDITTQKPTVQRRASSILTSQDGSAMLTFDLHVQTGVLEAIFTLHSMLSLRFDLGNIPPAERHRWLGLMRRNSGITFLWTKERWENDYMIFVVRENFARVYAFSTGQFEAGVRITLDVLGKLIDWLEMHWLDDNAAPSPSGEVFPPDAYPHEPSHSLNDDEVRDSDFDDAGDNDDSGDSPAFEW